tara:strand:+ start:28107 stop:28931 length:825 start_codon:yes stop_codon:yes gene_type:complete
MKKLLFGTAGIPVRTKGDTSQGIKDVNKLGLSAFELEFVRSVNISKEKAPEIKKVAKDNNVVLTCHGSYFVNLNSKEKPKYYASINRILSAARIANLCGAFSICFHAGFYQQESKEKTYQNIQKGLKNIVKTLKDENNKIWIRPEISGKISQFGDLKEIINLSKDIEQIQPCIDFAHLYARSIGKNNTLEEFRSILGEIEKNLGKKALQNMHIHIAGIEYGDKGEKHHLILKESKFNYKDLIKTFKEFKIKGVVICESPNIEKDALLLKKEYES